MALHTSPVTDTHSHGWAMACHFSALAGLLIPFGNLIGPFLVWQLKKNEVDEVDRHGRAALNFQLNLAFLAIALLLLAGLFHVIIFLVYLVGLASVIYAVVAGLAARRGDLFSYPVALKLLHRNSDQD